MTRTVIEDRVGHIKVMQPNIAVPGIKSTVAEALRHDNKVPPSCDPVMIEPWNSVSKLPTSWVTDRQVGTLRHPSCCADPS